MKNVSSWLFMFIRRKWQQQKKNFKNFSREMANILSSFEGWGPTEVAYPITLHTGRMRLFWVLLCKSEI